MSLKITVTFTEATAPDVTAFYNDLVAGVKGGQMPEVEIHVQAARTRQDTGEERLRQATADLRGMDGYGRRR